MKKIISFLLIFIVLLSSFVVPVSAVEETTTEDPTWTEVYDPDGEPVTVPDDYFPDLEEPTTRPGMMMSVKPEDITNGKYRLTKYLYTMYDDSGSTGSISSSGINTSDSINLALTSPEWIFNNNRHGLFYEYVRIRALDQSVMLDKGYDLKYTLSNVYYKNEIFFNNTSYYTSYLDTLPTNVTVQVQDFQGAMHVLDENNVTVEVRKSVQQAGTSQNKNGYYDIIININALDYDIIGITYKFAFYYKDFGNSENFMSNTNYKHYIYHGFDNSAVTVEATKADKTSGLLSGIIEWIKSIWQGITELPTKIALSLKGFFDNIANGLKEVWSKITTALTELGNFIIDGLKSLFIPSEGYFNTLFDNFSAFFEEKLGVLVLPFEVVADFMEAYTNIGEGSGKLVWNAIPIKIKDKTYTIMKNGQIDFKAAFTEILGNYYNVYFAFIDCILYFMLIRFAKRKYDSVIGSGQVSFDSGTE